MTGAVDRTFVRIGLAMLAFFVVAFLVFLVNQTAGLVDLVGTGWGPDAGRIALWTLVAAYALLLAVPTLLLFRLPKPLVPPIDDSGPEFDAYLVGLRARLAGNPRLAERPLETREEIEAAIASLEGEADVEIRQISGGVFLATAISQSGRLDAFLVLGALLRMVWRVSHVYWQRPTLRDMGKLYANVAGTAFVASELDDIDVATQVQPIISSVLGASVTAVPGFQVASGILVNSVLVGTANAFLALRVGAITKRYCTAMVRPRKRSLRQAAAVEAAGMLGAIVMDGTKKLGRALAGATATHTRRAVTGTGRVVTRTGEAAFDLGAEFVDVSAGALSDLGKGMSRGVRDAGETVAEATINLLEMLGLARRTAASPEPAPGADDAGRASDPQTPPGGEDFSSGA
jgi:hypothetical protein